MPHNTVEDNYGILDHYVQGDPAGFAEECALADVALKLADKLTCMPPNDPELQTLQL